MVEINAILNYQFRQWLGEYLSLLGGEIWLGACTGEFDNVCYVDNEDSNRPFLLEFSHSWSENGTLMPRQVR